MITASNTKTCPDCAEEIRADALVCRHCGHRFGRKPAEFGKFAVSNVVILVSLAGALAYVLARLAQTSFYGRFGLDPEEVGFTYAETLTRAAPILLVLLSALVGLVGYVMIVRAVVRRRSVSLSAETRANLYRGLRGGVVLSVGLLIVVSFYGLPLTYKNRADDVKNGKSVRPAGFWEGLYKNPLGLRAEPVRVSWIDDTDQDYDFGRRELMYLGRAEGVAVFYDPDRQRTVRVPDGAIVIEREE